MNLDSTLTCAYHRDALCHSCTMLGTPYRRQVENKQEGVRQLLADVVTDDAWLPPVVGPDRAFRNKAKLAVGGTVSRPTLGITDDAGRGVDLRECGVHAREIWDVIPDLAGFVTLTGLEPYDVARRTGTVKFVIVTLAPDGTLMLRFVVRERSDAERIAAVLPALLERLPQVRSVSANLHPEHKAVLEGEAELHLHGPEFFRFPLAERTLLLRHRSFFQTNTDVAQALYAQARAWADEVAVSSALDLYCGVGGFALHLAAPGRSVHGVEIEASAVEAARAAVDLLPDGCGPVTFDTADATAALAADPARATADLVVVNPPRRGLGEALCADLESSDVPNLLYSSCNPTTLHADLTRLPSYAVRRARVFDMFPQTRHSEVAVLLRRR